MNVLGSMVVRLALDMAGYKPDLDKAVAATTDGAAKIDTAATQAGTAATRLGGAMGGAAGQAVELAGAAGFASLGLMGLAAGAAAAGYAAYKGGQETQEYQKAIILTGNVSGTTASQMQLMAARIDDVVGAQYQAAAALTAMAATGQVRGQNLQASAQVAIEAERVLGTTVADTAKIFAKLGEEPVKASLALNESMNYLTASTFAQIKAAQDLGDKETAASLAQNAYATAHSARIAQVKEGLGILERSWIAIDDVAKKAWNAMLGLGRTDGIEKQIETQRKAVQNMEEQVAKGGLGVAQKQKVLDTLKETLGVMEESGRLAAKSALWQAGQVESEKAKIAWMAEGEKYLTKEAKLKETIARIEADGARAGAERRDIDERINFEREKAAGKPKKADNSAERELEKEAAILAKLAGVNADYTEELARLQRMRDKGTLSQLEYVEAFELLSAKQPVFKRLLDEQTKSLEKEEKASLAASAAHLKYLETLDKSVKSIQDEVAKQQEHTERLGLSKVAVAELDAAKLELMATEVERQAIRGLDKNLDESEYEALMKLAKGHRDLAKAKVAGARRETEIEGEKEIAAERNRGWQETDRMAREMFAGQEINAKRVGEVFLKSIKSAIYEATLQPLLFQVYADVTGSDAGGLGGIGGGGTGGGIGGLYQRGQQANSLYNYGTNAYNWFTGGGAVAPSGATGALASQSTNSLAAAGGGSYANPGMGAVTTTNTGGAASSGLGSAAAATIVFAVIALLASRDATRVQSTGDSNTVYDPTGNALRRTNNHFSDGGGYTAVLTDGTTQEAVDAANASTAETRAAHLLEIDAKANKYVDGLNSAYLQAAKSLGVGAVTTGFSFGSNDSNGGKFRLASSAGGQSFDSGEIALNEGELKLAANRAILAALQGSELPSWMKGVFDGVDAAQLDQEGIDAAIQKAVDLRSAYDVLQNIPGQDLTNISFETLNSIKDVAGELAVANTAFFYLGQGLLDVSEAGGAAAAGLSAAFGGLQAFQSQMQGFAQNYLGKEEQEDFTYRGVQDDLSKAGLNFTVDELRAASRGDIRAAVESLRGNVGTAEGQTQYAAAVKAANTLAGLKPALDNIAAAPVVAAGSDGWRAGVADGGGGVTDSALDDWERAAQAIVDTMGDLSTTMIASGPQKLEQLQAQLTIEMARAKAGSLEAMEAIPELARLTSSAYNERNRNSTDQAVFNARLVESLGGVVGVNPNAYGTVRIPNGAVDRVEAYAPQTYSPAAGATGGGAGAQVSSAELTLAMRDLARLMELVATNTNLTKDEAKRSADVLVSVTRGAPFVRTRAV